MSVHPFTPAEFRAIYARVPRVCVDLVLVRKEPPALDDRVLLTKRTIDPRCWHIPGGTLIHGERIAEAASRVASRELGLRLAGGRVLGVIEYTSHHALGESPIGIAYLAFVAPLPDGSTPPICLNDEASDYLWASSVPEGTHPDQREFIRSLLADCRDEESP